MLGYNKGQVLGLFKNTLPTRYYYLLFSIQNLREAVESAKKVMTKEKLDNKLEVKAPPNTIHPLKHTHVQ